MKPFCALLFATLLAQASSDTQTFNEINGLLCIKSEFTETHSDVLRNVACASQCSLGQRCQAFSTADGPCKLFVFDRCSKYVRDCSCNRTGRVFVKQQSRLPPGALCPAGYADDLCGTKYKFFNGITSWDEFKKAVSAEPGLVIMADITDSNELDHARYIMNGRNVIFLGGRQQPLSPEPSGGWFWASCNTSIDGSLWYTGEPNNGGSTECVTLLSRFHTAISDGDVSWNGMSGGLAKCLAPFS